MSYLNKLFQLILLLGVSATAMASDCGDAPSEPDIIDGASASKEELVENSNAVKDFIDEADAYLDCSTAYVKTPDFEQLADDAKKELIESTKAVLEARNTIGPEFNEQVQAYKEANPES